VLGLAARESGRHVLASACRRAENDVVGVPTGGMDQLASLLGREGHALLVDMRDAGTRPVPLPLAHAGLTLLVIDTGVRHRLTDGRYGQRRAAVERAAAQLGLPSLRDAVADDLHRLTPDLIPPARHVITEIARVRAVAALLDDGRVTGIGPLLDASHASLAEDFAVSCPELDTAAAAARAAGALGARMTGGGFGGSAIALVPVDRAAAVADALRLEFATAGYPEPRVRPAVPSAGAG
jgi:galactokinase